MSGARVIETAAAVASERDYLLGLLLEQGRINAAQWSTTFDADALRESLRRRARVRPGTDPTADRLRALGRGDHDAHP